MRTRLHLLNSVTGELLLQSARLILYHYFIEAIMLTRLLTYGTEIRNSLC